MSDATASGSEPTPNEPISLPEETALPDAPGEELCDVLGRPAPALNDVDSVDYVPPSGSFFGRYWVAVALTLALFGGAVAWLSANRPSEPYRLPAAAAAVPTSGCVTVELEAVDCFAAEEVYGEVLAVVSAPSGTDDKWADALKTVASCPEAVTGSAVPSGDGDIVCLGAVSTPDWSALADSNVGDCFTAGATLLDAPVPAECEPGALVTVAVVPLPDPADADDDEVHSLQLYTAASQSCAGFRAAGPSYWQWLAGNGDTALCLGTHS